MNKTLAGNIEHFRSYDSIRNNRVEEIYVKVLEDRNEESTVTIKLHKVRKKITVKKSGQTRRHLFP